MAQHADDDEASFVPSTRNSQLLHEEPHKRAKTGHLSRSEWDGSKQSPACTSNSPMSQAALMKYAGRRERDWPGRASILHALGNAYGMNSAIGNAIIAFRAALAAEPQGHNAAATRFLLARSLAENGEDEQALDELESAVDGGLWVSDQAMRGSAFEDLQDHPRFVAIRASKQNDGK